MAIINNLYMQIDGNNIQVHPYTESNAVWVNKSNGYNLTQALADLKNNAASDWSDVKNKPFNTLGTDFKVTDGRLQLNGSFSMEWEDIENKPTIFNSSWGRISGKPSIYPSDWSVLNNKPSVYNSDWNLIGNKPDAYPTSWDLISNIPTYFDVDWASIQNKPFYSINNQDFNVEDEDLSINNLIHFADAENFNNDFDTGYLYTDLNLTQDISGYILLNAERRALLNGYNTLSPYGTYYTSSVYSNNNQIEDYNLYTTSQNDLNIIYGYDNVMFECPENSSNLFKDGIIDYRYIYEHLINFSNIINGTNLFNNCKFIIHSELNINSNEFIFDLMNVQNFDNIFNNMNIYSGPNNFKSFIVNGQKVLELSDWIDPPSMSYNGQNQYQLVLNDLFSNDFQLLNHNNIAWMKCQ